MKSIPQVSSVLTLLHLQFVYTVLDTLCLYWNVFIVLLDVVIHCTSIIVFDCVTLYKSSICYSNFCPMSLICVKMAGHIVRLFHHIMTPSVSFWCKNLSQNSNSLAGAFSAGDTGKIHSFCYLVVSQS